MKNDDFGDRMKMYEGIEAQRRLIPLLPVIARLDGMCFSKFTRGMKRPFDPAFSGLMAETTLFLVQETNALLGYTQSDEITLVWKVPDFRSQIMFDGRVQKMTSYLAGFCTAYFNLAAPRFLAPEFYDGKMPLFDCRVWNVPSETEAANTVLWREKDATKNSISMAAQSVYSHKQLDGKSSDEKQEMLFQKGINWNDYPDFFKRGVFFQKIVRKRKFTTEELELLPAKHEARTNPELEIERSEVAKVEMPPFSKVTNREDVIFRGRSPIVSTQN